MVNGYRRTANVYPTSNEYNAWLEQLSSYAYAMSADTETETETETSS